MCILSFDHKAKKKWRLRWGTFGEICNEAFLEILYTRAVTPLHFRSFEVNFEVSKM